MADDLTQQLTLDERLAVEKAAEQSGMPPIEAWIMDAQLFDFFRRARAAVPRLAAPSGREEGEVVGRTADRIDALLGAMQLPLPHITHLQSLRESLAGLRDDLRRDYVRIVGDDPWSLAPLEAPRGAAPAREDSDG